MTDDTTDAAPADTERRAGRRGGGRAARRTMREAGVSGAAAFVTRTMRPYELVSDEGLELLEHNADTILEQVGV